MSQDEINPKYLMIFTSFVGFSYLTAGILQIILGFTDLIIPFIPSDPIVGMILVCVSLVFTIGAVHYRRKKRDAYAFMIVGMILAGIIFVLHIITILTNGLGWVLQLEDFVTWNIQSEVVPAIWLFPIYALILRVMNKDGSSLFDLKLIPGGEKN